jgi:hypothetical protein
VHANLTITNVHLNTPQCAFWIPETRLTAQHASDVAADDEDADDTPVDALFYEDTAAAATVTATVAGASVAAAAVTATPRALSRATARALRVAVGSEFVPSWRYDLPCQLCGRQVSSITLDFVMLVIIIITCLCYVTTCLCYVTHYVPLLRYSSPLFPLSLPYLASPRTSAALLFPSIRFTFPYFA